MKLRYHKMMTPSWLKNKGKENGVRFGTEVEWNDVELMVPADTRFNEAILHVPLLPKNELLPTAAFAVKIVAGLEYRVEGSFLGGNTNALARIEDQIRALGDRVDALGRALQALQAQQARPPVRDPLCVMIAGKKTAAGFEIRDPETYRTRGPYRGVEGVPGERGLLTSEYLPANAASFLTGDHAPTQGSSRWPQVFRMNLMGELDANGSQKTWGSISSDVDGGHATSFAYNLALDPAAGLRLAIYRGERNEAYRINYFEVSIYA